MNTNPQSNSYQIHDLTNPNSIPPGVHLYGIKFSFNGETKKIMFWFKNNIRATKRVTIVFESQNENIRMEEGNLVLSLKSLNTYQDIRMALIIFQQIMRNNQINNLNYHFIVNNPKQANMVKTIAQELGLSGIINNENQSLVDENVKKVEANLNGNKEYTASGSKTIEMSEGQRNVTANSNTAYENVSGNLTKQRMEPSSEQTTISNDNKNVGQVAIDKANNNNSKVNDQKLANNPNKSAAFASLSIILFILSGLLIITSLILYLLA